MPVVPAPVVPAPLPAPLPLPRVPLPELATQALALVSRPPQQVPIVVQVAAALVSIASASKLASVLAVAMMFAVVGVAKQLQRQPAQ